MRTRAERALRAPSTVAAEFAYLLGRGGRRVESQFLTSLANGTLHPVGLTPDDYGQAGEFDSGLRELAVGNR